MKMCPSVPLGLLLPSLSTDMHDRKPEVHLSSDSLNIALTRSINPNSFSA